MVDRITPSTSPEERDEIAASFGVDDRWPVITEPFSQWVVEDSFCAGRPPLETVGVHVVDDVSRYELMKTRLLNASHCAVGYLGQLAGYETIDQAVGDPVFSGYLTQLMRGEVIPLLPQPEGIDLPRYTETLLERFANPAISDKLSRLGRRGSTKIPNYVLPSLCQALEEGRSHEMLALAVAGWFRYLLGADEAGEPLEIEDAQRDSLQELARAGGTDPRPLLGERSLFGDLVDDEAFVGELEQLLEELTLTGARATLAAHLSDRPVLTGLRNEPAEPATGASQTA